MNDNTRKYIYVSVAIIFLAGLAVFSIVKKRFLTQSASPLANQPRSSAPLKILEKHVLIVVEENHSYEKVMGDTQDMPYLNSLANTYSYAKNYYADTHPSIGNYFTLTTGNTITNNSDSTKTVSDDNIVRHLIAEGKSWKEYSGNLPTVGYTGGTQKPYDQDHNPLAFFSDVRNNPDQAKNLVPFSQFALDLASNKLPDYSFIVPSSFDNADECPPSGACNPLAAADKWLETNIDPLIKSSDFSTPGGGVLVIVFDESAKSDKRNGGGHVAWVAVGPDVKKGYTSDTFYQHENTLRFMAELLGLTSFTGKAATADNMGEFLAVPQK